MFHSGLCISKLNAINENFNALFSIKSGRICFQFCSLLSLKSFVVDSMIDYMNLFTMGTSSLILSLISYRYADKKMRPKIESKFQHEGLS